MPARAHPLSENFVWTDVKGDRCRVTDAQVADFNEVGYFVMEDIFDEATVAELLAEIDPVEREFEDLLRQTLETDFAPLYRELEGVPDIDPGEIIPADRLITLEGSKP